MPLEKWVVSRESSLLFAGVDICAPLEYILHVGAMCGSMNGPEGSSGLCYGFVSCNRIRCALLSAHLPCLIRASACKLETSYCLPKSVNDLIICVQIDVKTS
jgi:hypothetical protein